MSSDRRVFLKSSLAATAAVAMGGEREALVTDAAAADAREFYELRCYHLKASGRLSADADSARVDRYLEGALLPALAARGLRHIGVFTELDVDKVAGTAAPKPASPWWVLIPHRTLESFVSVSGDLLSDQRVLTAGREYLAAPKSSPSFERIDSWLLRAFRGMPTLELPAFSRDRVPTRVFEMRDYESFSELKALTKMAMFDDGEIQLMRDLGMAPVFFGQALSGPNLPHLRYFTSGPDLASHLARWNAFGPDPRWIAMRDDPRYADSVSRNTARFLTPRPYSQI
jgi:NIPSNAP